MEHELKIWPKFFVPVRNDSKPFEVRKNDRNFNIGDTLLLKEWDPKKEKYTGRICRRAITYILPGGQFGVEPGYVVLGLAD